MMNETDESLNDNFKMNDSSDDLLREKNEDSIDVMFCAPLADFEHEEIIAETKWDNANDFIDIEKVIDLPNSTNAFIVNTKGANVMQEAYYLPVSPDDSQCWEIQRDDKFLIEADQANSFDIYTGDFSAPNVLRVSVIQKTPQPRGCKDTEQSISQDSITVSDSENLTESIWNDYTISQLPTLENNLENVITEDLMDTDIVDEQLLQQCDNATVAVLQPVSVDTDETLMVTCRCCNKNFTFYDLKLHIAEKSTEGYYGCDRCTEIFLLKEDLNNHVLTHLREDDHYDCVQCGIRLPSQADLIEHKKIHLPFRCSYCIEDFADVADLETHINELHATKRVKTDTSAEVNNAQSSNNSTSTCSSKVKEVQPETDNTIKKSVEETKPETSTTTAPKEEKIQIQCPKCKEKFKFAEEADVETYIKTHVPTTYYKCGFCDTIVTDKNEFNEHMKSHTPVVEVNKGNKFPYKCSYCENLAFETIEELTSHIEMHVPRSIFVCPKCNTQFIRENKKPEAIRIKPIRKETTNKLKTTPILAPADKVPTRENFKCKTCLAVFKKQDEFNKHVKTHIMPDTKQEISDVKVDPSYCAYCKSELLSIAEIIVHIRKHTEERKLYPCSNCDKKTSNDRNQNSNNRGKENFCNYCLSKMNGNFRIHG
ncbi:zinc finger protein 271-like isoform X2 [Planococcus citri]|uniref:zinc finger protein 271-like isoform X2 n=1 Tax=Planococcus citri TaxID=170843 RepID=UPI0031F9F59A